MAKYYFQKDDENCYNLVYHIQYMRENYIEQMEVFEAKAEYGTGYFFCLHYQEIGESGESCGKVCDHYSPRNGKNGRCKHHGNVYEQTDKVKLLRFPLER